MQLHVCISEYVKKKVVLKYLDIIFKCNVVNKPTCLPSQSSNLKKETFSGHWESFLKSLQVVYQSAQSTSGVPRLWPAPNTDRDIWT